MKKLYIITRDGKSAHEFCEIHNINYSNVVVVKKVPDIIDSLYESYVIVPPLPYSYYWGIKPLLKINKMINKTSYYNKILNKF